MTQVWWDPVLTACGGGPELALAFYMVVAGFTPNTLVEAARVDAPITTAVISETWDPQPEQVLYMRVHAFDVAGNSSEDCLAGG
jgi:hypothetical protein